MRTNPLKAYNSCVESMLKLALIAVLSLAPMAMASQQQKASGQSQGNAQQVTPPCLTINADQSTTNYQPQEKEKPQGWHKFVTWPEGIATWGLLLTLGAIIWQTVETRRSANASRRAVIASLRPRLVVKRVSVIPGKIEEVDGTLTLKDDHQWRIGCVVANIGGSVAQVIGSDVSIRRLGIGTLEGLLPGLPPYQGKYSFGDFSIEPGERLEKIVVLETNTETMQLRIVSAMAASGGNTGADPTVCFGFFHYRDANGVERRTGFGAKWNPRDMSFTRLEHSEYEYAD